MAIISDFLLRGVAASRPAASPYNAGFLYFSTDTLVTEQSTGSTWVAYSPTTSPSWTLVASQALSGAASYTFTGLGTPADLMVLFRLATFGSSDRSVLQVSVDNGSNYLSSSGDYISVSGAGAESNQSNIQFYDTNATAARSGAINIFGCNAAAPKVVRSSFFATDNIALRLIPSTSQINALKILSVGANNWTGGTCYIFKR